MTDRHTSIITPIPSAIRRVLAMIVFIIIITIILGALTIPFLFESPSMYYKFGWDKILLRTGKMVGLAGAIFLLFQLPMAARVKWLDRIFSLPVLFTAHRYNAYVILCLIFLHPIGVFLPDGTIIIPLEIRYWPEWVGAALLLVICLQWASSRWRQNLFEAYEKWLTVHRTLGAIAMILLFVHVLYVSETFEHSGFIRDMALVSAFGVLALWIWVRLQSMSIGKKMLRIKKIEPAGKHAYAIDLEPSEKSPYRYIPGQFVFVSFRSKHISKEPHPFTLSSSPSRPGRLELIIRQCGDWTRQIDSLQPGEKAYLQGPFGHFSHLFAKPDRDLIMIAGGIGITPMLSMLRYLNDSQDTRRIILIWSNKTPEHIFGAHELKAMEEKLTDFKWIPIFTRKKTMNEQFGRLDCNKLTSMLQSYDRNGNAYLCGPPLMIKKVRRVLIAIGFSKESIYTEVFGL